MKIAVITAGGAGMFCGSCMQDNTLVRALRMAGADAVLLPAYTPIRVDEDNVSSDQIFLGGINVYLDSKLPGWSRIPRFARRWLDRPGLVKWLSKLSSSTDAAALGPLTIDLLKGNQGPQRAEINELIRYLCDKLQPDIILFSNALLSGIVPELRRRFSGRICCLLQGDDIFLDGLTEPWRAQALRLIADNAAYFDALLTHSDYYARYMQNYLGLGADRFRRIPLSIEDVPASGPATMTGEIEPLSVQESESMSKPVVTAGYFARICPEKGASRFLDAAENVLPRRRELRMVITGYLPEQHRRTLGLRMKSLQSRFSEQFRWLEGPQTRNHKFRLLKSFDWLCVPTVYCEPKGLYVLEAALAGVPSLLPSHGAFPERIAALGMGTLYDPQQPLALEELLLRIKPWRDAGVRESLRKRCLQQFGMRETGGQVMEVLLAIDKAPGTEIAMDTSETLRRRVMPSTDQ